MYRTMLYGFYENFKQSIFHLIDKNILDVRCWIDEAYDGIKDRDDFIDIYSLFYSRFFIINKDKIEYYTSGVKFDNENYDIIFKKVFKFMEYYSRHSIGIHGYTPFMEYYPKKSIEIYGYTHIYDHFYMFNSFYRFIYGILYKEKIDIILFINIPHEGADLIVYEIAKSLNIKTLIFSQLHVKPYTSFYMTDTNDFGIFNYMLNSEDNKDIDFIHIEKKLETPFYMHIPNSSVFNTKSILKKMIKELLKIKKCKINNLRYFMVIYAETKNYNKHMKENIKQVNYDEKFVYFPLHLQPELTTSALGGIFTDQLLAIELLSDIIPDDWKIVVKENPKQGYFMRSDAFFYRLKNIGKAILCPLNEDTFELIERCKFIATVTGTVGLESLQIGKPILIFGSPFYSFLPGVFKYNKNFDLNELLNYKINHSELEVSFNKIIKKSVNVVIDYAYKNNVLDFNDTENNKNLASFIEDQIQKLFKDNRYNANRA